jgi:hypothetical protein
MLFYKKIVLAIGVAISIYILYKLQLQRRAILAEGKTEGFTLFSTPESEVEGCKDTKHSIQVNSANLRHVDLPLKELCIKASYNSCVSGRFVSTDMVKYVLLRGCRFLDLELFMIAGEVQVSKSNDPNFTLLETDNAILFKDVLDTIMMTAFAPPTPNQSDPLFIQLRVKTKDPGSIKKIAKLIHVILKQRLCRDHINKNTKLSEVMNKIVIIYDKNVDNGLRYDNEPCDETDPTCYKFSELVNIESGYGELYSTTVSDTRTHLSPQIRTEKDGVHTNVSTWNIATPDSSTTANDTYDDLVIGHGCQIVPYRFWYKDGALVNYEAAFDHFKAAFVPLSLMIRHLNKRSGKE